MPKKKPAADGLPSGLSAKSAKKKLAEYGYNEITELSKISPFRIFLRQIKSNFVVYLLFAAAVISFFVEKDITGYAILGVVFLVVIVGFIQEYKAETAIKALKQMIMPVSVVIRGGKETEIPSKEIVPDDILVLRIGERVPADCVVLSAKELRVNEAVLTGESGEVTKKPVDNGESDYENENLLFMGTHIVNGRCTACVLHTGMDTEFGKIAGLISHAEKELPLQKKINRIAKFMASVAVTVSILTAIVMLIRGGPITSELLIEVLIVAIALSVSAFPEGFPVVLISTLASGAYRMAQKNAIVNRMSIIETLGETTVICSDKTGTITKGEMTVKRLFVDGRLVEVEGVGYEGKGDFLFNGKKFNPRKDSAFELALLSSVLANDARIERVGTDSEYLVKGSPTEGALLVLAAKSGVFKEDVRYTKEDEIPFSSERKMMSVLAKKNGKRFVFSKGAPEIVLNKCRFIQKGAEMEVLSDSKKEKLLKQSESLASEGYRVISLAYKPVKKAQLETLEKDLVFLGFAALEDPARDEVKEAIEVCKGAGIEVKMITGDNKITAGKVAEEVGLEGEVLTGDDLDNITDNELLRVVKKVAIFARVRPEHKLRIVNALKKNGQIVTMTGDGVNDAPAIKQAHIGVAMGINGTDVSREAADLILRDDNFATIVEAVKEGRTIFSNIQKFISYQLSDNYAELFIVFFGILLGLPLPLIALQILFLNMVTDNMPAITLGFNPPSLDVMKQQARKKSNLLTRVTLTQLAVAGTVMGVVTLTMFYVTLEVWGQSIEVARTTAMVTLIFFEIANALNFRSFRYPVHKLPLFANKYLVYASAGSITATLIIIYTPLSRVFETAPIPPLTWLIAICTSLLVIVVMDLVKIRMKGRYI